MCGIGGLILNEKRDTAHLESCLRAVNDLQRHRGPDGEGIWVGQDGQIGLAHVRLSIIDLSTHASQPMVADNGNVVVHNGEIYNYIELREELGSETFRTTSDTEVILKAYERWGQDCVSRLRGMFAFAIWDAQKRELFIARDRFGIKPFYFAQTSFGFVFASEVKLCCPFCRRSI